MSRSYGMSRNDGRTCRSSKPIVAMRVRRATASPDEEVHARCDFHDEPPGVVRIREARNGPLRLELAHVMLHRRLVDVEPLRQGRLREVPVAAAAQKGA